MNAPQSARQWASPGFRRRQLLLRRKAALEARDDLLKFAKFMNPDPNDPDDVTKSDYKDQKYHRVISAAFEQVECGLIRRLNIDVPPRHGKTKLGTMTFVPWYLGRNPGKSVVVATYNEKFSWDLGRAIRATMRDPLYRQVFPDVKIAKGSSAVDRLETEQGGAVFLTGRGGTITGRGGNVLLVDDPIKDRKEADSPTIREDLWNWYTQVMASRMMTHTASVILIQTRWHDDDLPGRLLDPMNLLYNEAEAKYWHRIHLMAIAEEGDILGRKPGEALWPERFPTPFLQDRKRIDPRGFEALYQGRPSPESGAFFDAKSIGEYHSVGSRPAIEDLRIYAASDHAVSTNQSRDRTCFGIIGVDRDDTIWVFEDLFWKHSKTDDVVEAMVQMMKTRKPVMWWAERGMISKSIGPFLRKRMAERKVYCPIDEVQPVADKQSRAQSIAGRISMGKVMFPAYASWWTKARTELLKFPYGANDDFVDFLSLIGLGLTKQTRVRPVTQETEYKRGTFGYLLEQTRIQEQRSRLKESLEGW